MLSDDIARTDKWQELNVGVVAYCIVPPVGRGGTEPQRHVPMPCKLRIKTLHSDTGCVLAIGTFAPK